MCGLVGVAGEMNVKHEKVLRTLLLLDSLRGEDSTGVAFVNRHSGGTTVAKALGDPFNLFYDNKFQTALNRSNKVLIGHNRYATSGGVNKASAHPFDFDTLVGVHNGTLMSKHKLLDPQDYRVDSQNLYHHIEQRGLRDAINKLEGPNNAWSLVWWDKINETLNFLRNKERPLWVCQSEDGKTMFWASEAWMLMAACGREQISTTEIVQTQEDVHYSFKIEARGVIEKPHLARMAAPVYVPPVWNHTPKQTQTTPHVVPPQPNNVVKLPTAPKGVDVAKKETHAASFATSYLSAKGVTLEILNEGTDSNGARYLSLFDPKNETFAIRLYPRKDQDLLFLALGGDLKGDISSFDNADKFTQRGYYKVAPDSVVLIEEVEATAMNHKGKLIPESDWKRAYSACGWCSEELNPDHANRFTTSGECICPGCSKNKDVIESVNFI